MADQYYPPPDPPVDKKDFALSLDQIEALITDIAVNGDGNHKLRALAMLRAQQTQEAILPAPLNDYEVAQRLQRIMRGAGLKNVNLAYTEFLDKRRMKATQAIKALQAEDIGIDPAKLPRTLKSLYKKYPELKGPGFPHGYPVGKGPVAQAEWCRKAAVQIEVQRAQAKQRQALTDINGTSELSTANGTEATNASQGMEKDPAGVHQPETP